MAPSDQFGVAIRTTGLWISLYGIYVLIIGMAWLYQAPPVHPDNIPADNDAAHSAGKYLFTGTIVVIMGVALIRLADQIVSMSY